MWFKEAFRVEGIGFQDKTKSVFNLTGLKGDNQSDTTTLQGDPIIELEVLFS